MFGRFRKLLPTAVWGLGMATVWAARPMEPPQPGYLPQAGPEALRFRVIPPPVEEPPPPPPVQAPLVLPSPGAPPETKAATNVPPIQPITNGSPLEYNAREPIAGPPATAPETALSPQMLIKYFVSPTNSANTNVVAPNTSPTLVAPVGFTPPASGPPPSAPAPPTNKTPTTIPH